ncbi:AMSH-like ubiquitin thioesterase 3 [Linum perenne]
MSESNSFRPVHMPGNLMDDFLRLARENTVKNLETCGVLAGGSEDGVFHISMLIIPKQTSTSNSCQTSNEEEILKVQDNLVSLGWIHTHPTQRCFMSSVDLRTQYYYQVLSKTTSPSPICLSLMAGFQKNVPNVVPTSSGYPDSPYRSFPFHNASAKNGIHLCFQKMLTEAIAIVMAPTDKSSPKGIFRLSDPGGVTVIGKCQETGFHSHE